MAEKHYYQSLARSMMTTVILVSLMPLLMITIIAGYQYSVAYKARVTAHLRELVLKHDRSVDNFLKEKIAEIRVLADLKGAAGLLDKDQLENLHSSLILRHGGDFVDLGLVNESGIQVAYSGPFRLKGASYADAEWYRQARKQKVYVSDVFLGLRGLPHFIIAVLINEDGKEWVLRTTLDFIAFNKLVEGVRIGETGLAFIINRHGEFQTTPRVDLSKEVPFLKQLANEASSRLNLAQGRAVVQVADNPATGTETIFVTSPIKNGEWLMVYQQDTNDAFAELNQVRNLALAVLLSGCLAIVIMAYMLARRTANKVRKADEEKEMMNDQVVEAGKLVSIGELAAGIAHEINNPVAIMVEEAGWIQDLLDEGLDKDENSREVQRSLSQIRNQGLRCKDITHKLLSFARKIDPTVKRVNLNALVEEMVKLSVQRAKYASVVLETSLGCDIPDVAASPSELQQVLLNLINNAIDAMDGKGGNLDISTRFENGRVILSVADTGCGIPQANLARIFDPFFTTKPVGKGTGLGLSIIHGIINKMGGEISVRSVVGVGTTFTIRLQSAEPVEGV